MCQYDVVCFDEVSGVSFDQKDGVNIMKGYMESGEFSRGKESIRAYGSVVIEGFRQSLDQVAAFRFTDIGNSYSARRGSGQHVGVIGVAVFKEHQPRWQRKKEPVPIATRPYYEPYGGGGYDYRGEASKSGGAPAPAADAAATTSTPAAPAGAAKMRADYDDNSYSAEAARPRSTRLGTEYGESTYSSVREVSFTRKHKRRPDVLMTMYYDSLDGLRARGVPVDPPPYYRPTPNPNPQPWPYETDRHNQYAPPPPVRRY